MDRHRRFGLGLVLFAALTAGCLGFITGSEALEFSANETVVGDAALQETGYQEAGNSSIGQSVEISGAGQTRRVNVTNYLYAYNRSVDLAAMNVSGAASGGSGSMTGMVANQSENASTADAGGVNTSGAVQFSVLATPTQRVLGQSINPFAQVPTEQLVRGFLGTSGGTTSLQVADTRSVQSLGGQRTVTTFRTTDGDDQPANDLLVHVATIETGNDFVVVMGAHPAVLDEQDRIDTLIAGLEQPGT